MKQNAMTDPRLPPADRPALSEAPAILLATLVAPVAAFLSTMSIGFALDTLFVAIEDLVAHPAIVHVVSYIAGWRDPTGAAMLGCAIAWLGVVPAMMFLRVFGRLRLWMALSAGVLLPLSTVSAIMLLMWHSTSATTAEKFIVYGVLVAMTVPAALAAAVTFWCVYAWMRRRAARVPRETEMSEGALLCARIFETKEEAPT